MITMFIIIEDKPEEQREAFEAVKRSLGKVVEAHDEYLPRNHPKSAWTMALKPTDGKTDGTIVWIASNLAVYEMVVGMATGYFKKGVIGKVNVLTDLMFPAREGGKEEPNGLQVVAQCIESGLPVVVCSDTDHHDVQWLRPIFPLLEKAHPTGRIPVILDKKDWDKAVTSLADASA